MRLALLAALLTLSGSLATPGVAGARGPAPPAQASILALPLRDVPALSYVPPGFTTDGQQAIQAAEATPKLQALHRREHPLQYRVQTWAGTRWEVDFYHRGTLVAEVDVSPAGRATAVWTGPLAYDYGARGHFSGLFDSPWVVIPFGVMFLVPFVDWRRLARPGRGDRLRGLGMRQLDLLALLSFGISYWLFNKTHFVAAVWLVYPPLLYLLARMLVIGLRPARARGGGGGQEEASRMPVVALAAGLLALVGARVGLDLASHKVIDVGYASVIGAQRIAHHLPLYYASDAHGDTYGPVAYLGYVPFEQLWPFRGFGSTSAARAAAITFDLLTIGGLVALGMRLREGVRGLRLGLLLGWAFAACPMTLLGLMNNTNDGLVAMLLVFSLLALNVAPARGALLGLAAAAKFAPLALLPVIARGRGTRRPREALVCAAVSVAVVALLVGLFLPAGGLREFYDHTIGYQLGRSDPFSIWGLHPGLAWLKTVVAVAAVLLALAVALGRGPRTAAQVAALSAAVVIAVQLPAEHWFYFYIVWFAPLVLIAVCAREPLDEPALAAPEQRGGRRPRRTAVAA